MSFDDHTPFEEWARRFKRNPWAVHPEFTLEKWKDEVMNNETRVSYHEWVLYHSLTLADNI